MQENSVNSGEWDKEMKMKAELHGSESELWNNHISFSKNILPDKSMR